MQTKAKIPLKAPSAKRLLRNWPLHLMLLPCILLLLLFNYAPMVGISIAFQRYNPTKGFSAPSG